MKDHIKHRIMITTASILLAVCSIPSYALTLTSSEFFNQDTIPIINTCNGKDISPDLSWSDVPANTVSFALILSDLDAPTGVFYHWVLFNIPPSVNTLPSSLTALPPGAIAGKTTWGGNTYKGPCPPSGTHRYVFSLYALNTELKLDGNAEAPAVLDAMQDHVVGEADLKVTYTHGSKT